jgi:phospholipid/cholesterol/gamma-HCH transport system ATP-binding protein
MNPNNHPEPAVCLDHVSKAFEGRKVLEDVSFQVGVGEAFCLLGRSGAGKSVTLKLIIGLLKPDQGKVFVHGQEMHALQRAKLGEARKKIGFLFQDAALFDSISVYENVAFPLHRHTNKSEDEIRSVVQEKLDEVELGKEGKKKPSELSGGMRKRAGLARALALEPDVLLVDEPSSGLDHITATEIYELLLSLKQKRHVTLVAVTHDVAGARKFADRFAVLNKGRIVECGSVEEMAESDDPVVRNLAAGVET